MSLAVQLSAYNLIPGLVIEKEFNDFYAIVSVRRDHDSELVRVQAVSSRIEGDLMPTFYIHPEPTSLNRYTFVWHFADKVSVAGTVVRHIESIAIKGGWERVINGQTWEEMEDQPTITSVTWHPVKPA